MLYFWLHVPGLSKARRVVVAVVGLLHPLFGHVGGELAVRGGLVLLAGDVAELAEGAERDDGLERQVGIVGEMAGEVVGAELVLGGSMPLLRR